MRKITAILLAALTVFLLILTACGGDDDGVEKCKKPSDCKYPRPYSKQGYVGRCVDKACTYQAKPNVCGNGLCDSPQETLCSCAEDCSGKDPAAPGMRACEGAADETGLLEYTCDLQENCVVKVAKSEAKSRTETISLEQRRVPQAKVLMTMEYEQPFNTEGNLFNIKFKLDEKAIGVEKVTLKKVQVMKHTGELVRGRWQNDKPFPIYDGFDIDRVLWDPLIEVMHRAPLNGDDMNGSDASVLTVKVQFSYDGVDARGSAITYEEEKEFDLEDFVILKSSAAVCDVVSCNDNNACTTDRCVVGKGYCENVVKSGKCKGNFKCDAGESKCSAPEDCGYCKGEAGEFSEYACSADNTACEIHLSREGQAKVEQKALTNEQALPSKSSPDIRFKVIKKFNDPFKSKSDEFVLTVQMLDKKTTTTGFTVNNLELIEGTSLLGSFPTSQAFNAIGDSFDFKVPFNKKLVNNEEKHKLKVKVTYSYKGVDRREQPLTYTNQAFEEDLGEVLIVNAK